MSNVEKKIKQLKASIRKSYTLETTNAGEQYRLYFNENQVSKICKLIAKECLDLNYDSPYNGVRLFWQEVIEKS